MNRGRILLVDDDPAVRLALRGALESEAYTVIAVGTGHQALEEVWQGKIDVVLLDINLPDMNGWDVFEQASAISPSLPVLVITARPDQYQLAEAAGATGLMEKPLSLPVLIEAIDRLLGEGDGERARRLVRHKPIEF